MNLDEKAEIRFEATKMALGRIAIGIQCQIQKAEEEARKCRRKANSKKTENAKYKAFEAEMAERYIELAAELMEIRKGMLELL